MRLTDLLTPLKPLDATAQGELLVASDVGGDRELIRDGENGTLFRAGDAEALADAMKRMLAGRIRWERMRVAGRTFVENDRAWARCAANYRSVYRRLLPPSRRNTVEAACSG